MDKKFLLIGIISLIATIIFAGSSFAIYIATRNNYNTNMTREVDTREIPDFSKLYVDADGRIEIQKADTTELVIEGPKKYLDRISTEVKDGTLSIVESKAMSIHITFNLKEEVIYRLKVKNIENIDLNGVTNLNAEVPFTAESFVLNSHGTGNVNLGEVNAKRFTQTHTGAGNTTIRALACDTIEVNVKGTGNTTLEGINSQQLKIVMGGAGNFITKGRTSSLDLQKTGVGNFYGKELVSETANLKLDGAGNTEVAVKDEMTVNKTGVGNLTYYGDPKTRNDISGVGNVRRGGGL